MRLEMYRVVWTLYNNPIGEIEVFANRTIIHCVFVLQPYWRFYCRMDTKLKVTKQTKFLRSWNTWFNRYYLLFFTLNHVKILSDVDWWCVRIFHFEKEFKNYKSLGAYNRLVSGLVQKVQVFATSCNEEG